MRLIGKYSAVTAICAVLMSSGPAFGQQMAVISPKTQAPAPRCELHIWPANRFGATTTLLPIDLQELLIRVLGSSRLAEDVALVPDRLIDANFHKKGDKRRLEALTSQLNSVSQIDSIGRHNPAERLDRKNYDVLLHEDYINRGDINNIFTRRSASNSPCYAELFIADIRYRKSNFDDIILEPFVHGLNKSTLRTLFIFREFGNSDKVKYTYKSWKRNTLHYFPPKYDEEIDLSRRELVEVFQDNFASFARKVPHKP